MTNRVRVWGEIGPSFVVGADRRVNEHTLIRMIDAILDAGAELCKVQLKSFDGPRAFYANDPIDKPPVDPDRAPFATRGEYIRHREPDRALLQLIDAECTGRGLDWTASPWDIASVGLLAEFAPEHVKVASACMVDDALLLEIRRLMPDARLVVSTGMSTMEEIDHMVELLAMSGLESEDLTLAVCTAKYPAEAHELNIARIGAMIERYPAIEIGWSSHSPMPHHAALAVAAGARWIEQHITTGCGRWGSDHESSLEPEQFKQCVRLIREAEKVRGSGRIGVLACEQPARERLRRTA